MPDESTADHRDGFINAAIVGGGKGCRSLLKMVNDILGRFRLRIQGVADVDPQAPGLRYAREIGVPLVTADYRELYEIPGLDLIIELTGSDEVRDEIERTRPRSVSLIDHVGARLLWELTRAEEAVIRQRTEEAEIKLNETREYLQKILDNSPVIIVTTDLEGNIVSFNRGAEESLGYSAEEVIGKPAAMFYQDPSVREGFMRRVKSGEAVKDFSHELLRKDGTLLPVSITLSQLKDAEGRMIGTVGMSKDTSRRTALIGQVLQAERMAAVGRVASGLAHEINNPLAVIGEIAGFLGSLIDDGAGSDEAELRQELAEGLPKIIKQVKRVREITRRLLTFARKTEAWVDVADVNVSLDEILPFLRKEANLARATIHRDYQEDLPRVPVEEMQLQEVFINLITNAIHAVARNNGGNIWLTTSREGKKVVITVKDDGPGIDESVRDRLFEPFVSTKTVGEGTGLGLSICYGIVKRYDGEIRVHSKPGQGTTFTVILPANEPAGRPPG